jgi:hypothetical protein
MLNPEQALQEMRAVVNEIRANALLLEDTCFEARLQAIDRLEFEVLDRLMGLFPATSEAVETLAAKQIREEAGNLIRRFEACNDDLFQRLRDRIRARTDTRTCFLEIVREHLGMEPFVSEGSHEPGYDVLDAFLNGLFTTELNASETVKREPEMVFYQKTPARVVWELAAEVSKYMSNNPGTMVYDLGSGLGQVSILLHLLTNMPVRGVEYEPSYCAYATQCAADLGLSGERVSFLNADVRVADLSDASLFFLYTPFTGKMMEEVLERLRFESKSRSIRIFTYGPCTHEVYRQSWLNWDKLGSPHTHGLGVFRSAV